MMYPQTEQRCARGPGNRYVVCEAALETARVRIVRPDRVPRILVRNYGSHSSVNE